MTDLRNRPWPVFRVVVEVKVPPTVRATEADLAYHVEQAMPKTIMMRRDCHANAQPVVVRIKRFTAFMTALARKEKAAAPRKTKKKEKRNDEYHGL